MIDPKVRVQQIVKWLRSDLLSNYVRGTIDAEVQKSAASWLQFGSKPLAKHLEEVASRDDIDAEQLAYLESIIDRLVQRSRRPSPALRPPDVEHDWMEWEVAAAEWDNIHAAQLSPA
jgi:hypothetical protein